MEWDLDEYAPPFLRDDDDDDDDDGNAPPEYHDDYDVGDEEPKAPVLKAGGSRAASTMGTTGFGTRTAAPTVPGKSPNAPRHVPLEVRMANSQISELEKQNQILERRLQQQSREIQMLKEVSNVSKQYESARAGDEQDARDLKILEHTKKIRVLNMALERERRENSKLLEQVQTATALADAEKEKRAKTQANPSQSQVAELKEKLNAATRQLHIEKTHVDNLKADVDKAHRALRREVGDAVPLETVLSEGSDWRGRAQQVTLLKDKLKELKRTMATKLAEGGGANGTIRPPPSDDHQRDFLKERETRKRVEMEAQAEIDKLSNELHQWKSKASSAQARAKNLEDTTKKLKEKIGVLITKTENDNKLIEALKAAQRTGKGPKGGIGHSSTSPHGTAPPIKGGPLSPTTPKSHRSGTTDAASQQEHVNISGRLASALAKLKEKEDQTTRQEKIILRLRDELRSKEDSLADLNDVCTRLNQHMCEERTRNDEIASSHDEVYKKLHDLQGDYDALTAENKKMRELLVLYKKRQQMNHSGGQ